MRRVSRVPPRVARSGTGSPLNGVQAIVAYHVARVVKLAPRTKHSTNVVVARWAVQPLRIVVAKEPRKKRRRDKEKDRAPKVNVVPPCGHLYTL